MAAPATEEEAFYLEQVTLDDDEDDDFEYKEVDVDAEDEDLGEDAAEDEDLEQALQTMKTREDGLPMVQEEAPPRPGITRRPEVLDDFIRNVLLKMGMVRAPPHAPEEGWTSRAFLASADGDARYVPARVVPAAGRGQDVGGGHGHGA
jgi:hypothetical protein